MLAPKWLAGLLVNPPNIFKSLSRVKRALRRCMDLVAFLRGALTLHPHCTWSGVPFSPSSATIQSFLGWKMGGAGCENSLSCGYRRLDTGHWAWRCLVLDLGEIPWVCVGIGFIKVIFFTTFQHFSIQPTLLDRKYDTATNDIGEEKTELLRYVDLSLTL